MKSWIALLLVTLTGCSGAPAAPTAAGPMPAQTVETTAPVKSLDQIEYRRAFHRDVDKIDPLAVQYWLARGISHPVWLELENAPPEAIDGIDSIVRSSTDNQAYGVPPEWVARILDGENNTPTARRLMTYMGFIHLGGQMPIATSLETSAKTLLEHPDLAHITEFGVWDMDIPDEPSSGGGAGFHPVDGSAFLRRLSNMTQAQRITRLVVDTDAQRNLKHTGELQNLRVLELVNATEIPADPLLALYPNLKEIKVRDFGGNVGELERLRAYRVTLSLGLGAQFKGTEDLNGVVDLSVANVDDTKTAAWIGTIKSLERLEVGMSDPSLVSLFRELKLPRLKSLALNLRRQTLGKPQIEALDGAGALAQLEKLRIYSATLDRDGAETLTRLATRLVDVEASYLRFEPGAFAAFLAGVNLVSLELVSADLTLDNIRLLAATSARWKLKSLNLRSSKLGLEGTRALLKGHWPELESIDLTSCEIDDDSARLFASTDAIPNVTYLEIYAGNRVGIDGKCAISGRYWADVAQSDCP